MLDVLFVQNYYDQHLGIMQISALLGQYGFTTDVAIGSEKHIIKKVLKENPQVLGIYCTTGFHHKNIALAKEIKRLLGDRIIIVFGGPHPTFVPEMIHNEGVDVICRGEGEYAMLELMQSLRRDEEYIRIKNLTVKTPEAIYRNEIRPFCDIDALPHPSREVYKSIKYIYRMKQQKVILGRGCPFSCAFCSSHAFRKLYEGKGNYIRCRSIPNVIDELEKIKVNYKPLSLFFYDDAFILKDDYYFEFLPIYRKKINLPFACMMRADLITEDKIKLLKEAGCFFTEFGIESGNRKIRNALLKKDVSDEQILNSAFLLHKYKIPFITFNMVGTPHETLGDIWDTVDMNIRLKPIWARFSVYQTLPATELAEYALSKRYINHIDVASADATCLESSVILRGNPQEKKILRLKNTASLAIKIPFLKKIIKNILLNVPLDKVYRMIDKLFYYVCFQGKTIYKLSFTEALCTMFFYARRRREFE